MEKKDFGSSKFTDSENNFKWWRVKWEQRKPSLRTEPIAGPRTYGQIKGLPKVNTSWQNE